MEDAAIVSLYWARNQQAIAETDQKYGTFCRKLAQNIVDNREDAEECVSDTWLRAWNTMPPQRPCSLRAYLGRIIRNLSLDRWRSSRAQMRDSTLQVLLGELEDCLPGGENPAQTVENRQLTAAIERYLLSCKRGDRILFVRRYWYGDSVQELAQQAGCSPAQVSRRLYTLRRGLRAALEREEWR